jgi:hypothetical protein
MVNFAKSPQRHHDTVPVCVRCGDTATHSLALHISSLGIVPRQQKTTASSRYCTRCIQRLMDALAKMVPVRTLEGLEACIQNAALKEKS